MQARHSATVTSYMPSAKGLASVTLWLGCSLGSPRATPMVKLPAGTRTMIGQSVQSWKLLGCLLRVAGDDGDGGSAVAVCGGGMTTSGFAGSGLFCSGFTGSALAISVRGASGFFVSCRAVATGAAPI